MAVGLGMWGEEGLGLVEKQAAWLAWCFLPLSAYEGLEREIS